MLWVTVWECHRAAPRVQKSPAALVAIAGSAKPQLLPTQRGADAYHGSTIHIPALRCILRVLLLWGLDGRRSAVQNTGKNTAPGSLGGWHSTENNLHAVLQRQDVRT